jgi:hypothetical protein
MGLPRAIRTRQAQPSKHLEPARNLPESCSPLCILTAPLNFDAHVQSRSPHAKSTTMSNHKETPR